MRSAGWEDIKTMVEVLTDTFEENPGSTWLLRKTIDRRKGIKRLCRYVSAKAITKDGAYISDNSMGVAICYRFNNKKKSLREFFLMLWFGITSINFARYREVLSREAYRESHRPADGNYLYFWFYGVRKGGERAAWDLARGIFKIADELGLEIYLETALPRMKPVYERYGFSSYHYWEDSEKDIRFWFMKRKPAGAV